MDFRREQAQFGRGGAEDVQKVSEQQGKGRVCRQGNKDKTPLEVFRQVKTADKNREAKSEQTAINRHLIIMIRLLLKKAIKKRQQFPNTDCKQKCTLQNIDYFY